MFFFRFLSLTATQAPVDLFIYPIYALFCLKLYAQVMGLALFVSNYMKQFAKVPLVAIHVISHPWSQLPVNMLNIIEQLVDEFLKNVNDSVNPGPPTKREWGQINLKFETIQSSTSASNPAVVVTLKYAGVEPLQRPRKQYVPGAFSNFVFTSIEFDASTLSKKDFGKEVNHYFVAPSIHRTASEVLAEYNLTGSIILLPVIKLSTRFLEDRTNCTQALGTDPPLFPKKQKEASVYILSLSIVPIQKSVLVIYYLLAPLYTKYYGMFISQLQSIDKDGISELRLAVTTLLLPSIQNTLSYSFVVIIIQLF